ncbi:MAG: type II toxin-antitoxin system VapC family toxin [Opitutales bacterium]|nr:type II toxin-antitoxin system VapC family toxin [Opitutales bacterium]
MPTLEHVRGAVLDTHVWVWTAAGEARAASMSGYRGLCIISAISLWEVAMLESKGRLALEPSTEAWIQTNLAAPAILEPLSGAIAAESCRLPGFHGDPADRIIVATARLLGVPLITADEKILRWNRERHLLQVIAP